MFWRGKKDSKIYHHSIVYIFNKVNIVFVSTWVNPFFPPSFLFNIQQNDFISVNRRSDGETVSLKKLWFFVYLFIYFYKNHTDSCSRFTVEQILQSCTHISAVLGDEMRSDSYVKRLKLCHCWGIKIRETSGRARRTVTATCSAFHVFVFWCCFYRF